MFNNQNPQTDLKAYYKNFYFQNKFLVYMMAASILGLVIAKASFFDVIYFVYLIYFGGFLLKQYLGDQKVLTTFLVSGVLGALVYFMAFSDTLIPINIIPAFIGSGALGLLTAAATNTPNMEIRLVFFGNAKIKWVVLVLIAIDLISILSNAGQDRIAHIGGIAYGFFSIYLMQNHSFNFMNSINNLFKKPGPYYDKSKNKQPNVKKETDEAYNQRKHEEQAKVDLILDKIKKKGYESLTAEEKQKLFDRSQRD